MHTSEYRGLADHVISFGPIERDEIEVAEIDAQFRRRLRGLRRLPRHQRASALRAAREERFMALRALRERRIQARAARSSFLRQQLQAPRPA
jgi:hypothetical protein